MGIWNSKQFLSQNIKSQIPRSQNFKTIIWTKQILYIVEKQQQFENLVHRISERTSGNILNSAGYHLTQCKNTQFYKLEEPKSKMCIRISANKGRSVIISAGHIGE